MDQEKDMAICFVLFNPTQSKRIIMNYLYVKNIFEAQGLPCYTLELVYESREPEVYDAFHISGSSFMFHKENLYRILEKNVPSHFTKLAFLDADVLFSDKQWYRKTSELLNSFDVVHPFETCHWFDLTYKKTNRTLKSVVCNEASAWDNGFHPGFAWCMKREFYKKVGFFEYALAGGGDVLSCGAWLRKQFSEEFQTLSPPLRTKYQEFQKLPVPTVTYLKECNLYHLFHGTMEKRQYNERHKVFHIEGDIEDYIEPNKEGLWEWKDKEKWNPLMLDYFKKRDDDGLGNSIPFGLFKQNTTA